MSQDKTAPMAPFKYHTNGRNWFVTGQDHYGGRAYVADIHHCRDQDGNKCAEEIARLFAAAPLLLAVLQRFVSEWDATWTDPDEVSHEWAELYQQAKTAIAKTLNAE